MSHVLTYFTFFGAALSMITHDADSVVSYVSGAAGFAGFVQVVGALHLMFVQGYVIYEKLPPGFAKSVRDLAIRIFLRGRSSEKAETDGEDPQKATRKQSIKESKGSAKMIKGQKSEHVRA